MKTHGIIDKERRLRHTGRPGARGLRPMFWPGDVIDTLEEPRTIFPVRQMDDETYNRLIDALESDQLNDGDEEFITAVFWGGESIAEAGRLLGYVSRQSSHYALGAALRRLKGVFDAEQPSDPSSGQ